MLTTTATTRRTGSTGYTGPADRDGRIDILRGIAIVFLTAQVVLQMVRPSPTLFEATGTLSALAFIVVAEGAIVGMIYRPRLAGGAFGQALLRLWRSSRALYVTAVAATLAVLALSFVPGLNTGPVTDLTADGGARASLLAPPVTDLADATVGYPVDPHLVLDIALLRLGPWPLDVIGLLCVLFFLAPVALWALSRGRWVSLLVVSAALYAVELVTQLRILPMRAEASLPVLGWQALFVFGMVAGYYRRELLAWFGTAVGRIAFGLLTVIVSIVIVLPLFIGSGFYPDLLASLASASTGWLIEPSAPGPIRTVFAVMLIIVVYGLLTTWWRPLGPALGWLLAPLGRTITAAMILLVGVGILIVSIPVLRDAAVAPALLVAGAVALIWGAIRLATLWANRDGRRSE
jgi:hypothetical protein